jgi:predicted AAA+ superfamily ATPase
MERALQNELQNWKKAPNRLPLIIQGARQVGKTYLMKWFGQTQLATVGVVTNSKKW